jgi:hypothetical protein
MVKSVPNTVFGAVIAFAFAWSLAVFAGFDRRTTIDVGERLSLGLMIVFSVTMSLWLLGSWLFRPDERWMSDRIRSLWRQYPTRYRALGVSYAALIGAASWGVAFLWLSTIAQHLPGPDRVYVGTVIDEQRVVSGRSACRHELRVKLEGDARTTSLCVASRGSPVPFPSVVIGDRVKVTLRETMLGRHLLRIDPISDRSRPGGGSPSSAPPFEDVGLIPAG